MNAKHLIAAFAVLAATGSVFAQEFVAPDAGFVSTRTRAEVVAEVAQARADGSLEVKDSTYPVLAKSGTTKTRAEVVAGIAQARANGTLDAKDATYPVTPTAATGKTRAEVRAELVQYQKVHPYGVDSLYSGA
jgi:hypothetical protein